MGHSSLAVYSGRKRSKKPKLFTKFVFCLSPQFSLTMLPIDLREDNRERHRPKGIAKEKVLAPRVPAHDAGLMKLVYCVSGVMGSCHFLVRSSGLTDLGGEVETREQTHEP